MSKKRSKNQPDIVYSGSLLVKGIPVTPEMEIATNDSREWVQLWVVAHDDALWYFLKEKDAKKGQSPVGAVPLTETATVRKMDKKSQLGKMRGFELIQGSNTYYFVATDETSFNGWYDALVPLLAEKQRNTLRRATTERYKQDMLARYEKEQRRLTKRMSEQEKQRDEKNARERGSTIKNYTPVAQAALPLAPPPSLELPPTLVAPKLEPAKAKDILKETFHSAVVRGDKWTLPVTPKMTVSDITKKLKLKLGGDTVSEVQIKIKDSHGNGNWTIVTLRTDPGGRGSAAGCQAAW